MTGEEEEAALSLKKQWLALQRLLYCMEQPPHHNGETGTSGMNNGSGWHALLLRAQHCQDLWQDIQIHEGTDMDPQTHIEISQRVDQACRRAHEMAEIARKHQMHQNGSKSDLIDRIFFMEFGKRENDGAQGEEDDDPYDSLLDDDDSDLGGGMEPVTSEDTASVDEEAESRDVKNMSNVLAKNTSISMGDLQQAQREQMEEAIGLMAAQMKDATQGIQQQLQQQTQKTLTELETVAEQNVHDVTVVARSVEEHNHTQRRRNWGTWTLLFVVVGMFCFCLVTIFTIPKRPNTCLVFCSTSRGEISLVGWLVQPVQVVSRSILRPAKLLWEEYTGTMDKDDTGTDTNKEHWNQLYHEDETQRQEKEKLARLLKNIQKEATTGSSSTKEEFGKKLDWRTDMDIDSFGQQNPDKRMAFAETDNNDDEPFVGRKPVEHRDPHDLKNDTQDDDDDDDDDDDNPFASRKPVKRKPLGDIAGDKEPVNKEEHPPREVVGSAKSVKKVVEEVNMADLLASLNRAAQQKEDLVAMQAAAFHKDGPMGSDSRSFADMAVPKVEDEVMAKRRVSPRDIRTAAESGNVEQLLSLLELQPSFVDRQDRNKWSALHLAARRGQTEAVRILHGHGASLALENSRGKTALDEAIAHLEPDHPTINLLRELGGNSRGGESSSTRGSSSSDREPGRQMGKGGDDVGQTRPVNRDTLRLILETRDDDDDLDSYVQVGREKLEQLKLDTLELRVRSHVAETIFLEEEDDEDLEQYMQVGRSRLDTILGTEGPRIDM